MLTRRSTTTTATSRQTSRWSWLWCLTGSFSSSSTSLKAGRTGRRRGGLDFCRRPGSGFSHFLPVHFVSGVFQFSVTQGLGRWHQFGSPARLYVRAGKSLVVSGGSSKTEGSPDPSATISLFASAIEHLLDE